MRDHTPFITESFQGHYDRGDEDSTPLGYFIDTKNVRYLRGGVATRYGTTQSITIPAVKRQAIYKRIGEAQRLLLLDNVGNIYDSTNLATPILSILEMTDFSMVTIFNRAYITPHNGETGLPGEKVYVYEGVGVARPAAGVGPGNGSLTVATSALSGRFEAGWRGFGIVFQTSSGYITKPGFLTAASITEAFKADLSGIPLGGATVVARHVIGTKIMSEPTEPAPTLAELESAEWFFVPDGHIADNLTTSLTVDYYDAQLQRTADYLFENAEEIPAGVGIGLFRGKMIVYGENASPSIIRVSEVGEPEAMNEADGYITVNPGDSGGGIKKCTEYRAQLVICKSMRTYGSQDNGARAAFWEVASVDMSIGTECHGIGQSLDFGDNVQDALFIADRAGLRLFVGTYPDTEVLTQAVDDIWGRITKTWFNQIEVAVDPVEQLVYVAVPLDGASTPTHILYGDYSEGMTAVGIKWALWAFPKIPTTVCVDVINQKAVLRIGSLEGNVYNIDPDNVMDGNLAIESYIEFPFLPIGENDDVFNHFTGIRLRIRGVGDLEVRLRSLDTVNTLFGQSINLSVAPGRPMVRLFNFVSTRCAIRLRVTNVGHYFTLTRFAAYLVPLWDETVNG